MPRKPRLDVPGLIYHVMARGIEKKAIFADDIDRTVFLARLGDVLALSETPIYAFSLMPNHLHLLLRRTRTPVATVMRRLLTGYAMYFNKRHARVGYVFQNRYKAIICQEDAYLLELVRYISLNPIRAGIVSSLMALDDYPFASHSLVMGKGRAGFFDPDIVLELFGRQEKQARNRYRAFIREGLNMDRKPQFSGGGLKRSLGFPQTYPKKKQAYDDRVLGDGIFVEQLLAAASQQTDSLVSRSGPAAILTEVARNHNVSEREILGPTRNRQVTAARAIYAYRLAKETGASASSIARQLGVTRSSAQKMIERGANWDNAG